MKRRAFLKGAGAVAAVAAAGPAIALAPLEVPITKPVWKCKITYYVSANGHASNTGLRPGSPLPSLQSAFDKITGLDQPVTIICRQGDVLVGPEWSPHELFNNFYFRPPQAANDAAFERAIAPPTRD